MPRAFRGLHSRTLPQTKVAPLNSFRNLSSWFWTSFFCLFRTLEEPVKLCLHVKLCMNSDYAPHSMIPERIPEQKMNMRSAHFLTQVLACICLTFGDERPHIVLVMADDHGGDTGARTTVQTPHLDAMADRGVVFNRFMQCRFVRRRVPAS